MSRIHPVVAIKICNTFHGHLSNTFLSSFTASGKVVDWYTDKLTLTSLAYKQTKKQETHDWHQSALWFTTTLLFQVNPSETMHNNFKKSPTAYLWLLLIVFRVLFFLRIAEEDVLWPTMQITLCLSFVLCCPLLRRTCCGDMTVNVSRQDGSPLAEGWVGKDSGVAVSGSVW